MNAPEITDKLGLHSLRNRNWYIQATCATSGDGLYEGLDWLSNQLKNQKWVCTPVRKLLIIITNTYKSQYAVTNRTNKKKNETDLENQTNKWQIYKKGRSLQQYVFQIAELLLTSFSLYYIIYYIHLYKHLSLYYIPIYISIRMFRVFYLFF